VDATNTCWRCTNQLSSEGLIFWQSKEYLRLCLGRSVTNFVIVSGRDRWWRISLTISMFFFSLPPAILYTWPFPPFSRTSRIARQLSSTKIQSLGSYLRETKSGGPCIKEILQQVVSTTIRWPHEKNIKQDMELLPGNYTFRFSEHVVSDSRRRCQAHSLERTSHGTRHSPPSSSLELDRNGASANPDLYLN